MSSATWWIALILTASTAGTFLVAVVAFFKSCAGRTGLRMVLLVSIVCGLVAIFTSLGSHPIVSNGATWTGSVLILCAQALFWSAIRAHGTNRPSAAFATAAPPKTVEVGPYAFVRHPFYTAYILAFAAGAVFTERAWMWLVDRTNDLYSDHAMRLVGSA